MKKLTICCLVIAVSALFTPVAQAGTKCIHLTNFCDGLEITSFPTIAGTAVVGLWDWVCLGNNTGSLIAGAPTKFGGQPIYPYSGGTGSGFAGLFALNGSLHEFDLWGSMDGFTVFAFQTNQPYTTTKGKCNPLARTNPKRPAVVR